MSTIYQQVLKILLRNIFQTMFYLAMKLLQ